MVAMATLAELARQTDLEAPALAHLHRLVASWGLLADLCFADLLLYVPVDRAGKRFVVLGQIRPTTSQTLYREDQMGRIVDEFERPLVQRAWQLGEIIDGEVNVSLRGEIASVQCIPVRWKESLLAILTRESAPSVGRRPGELERVYVEIFDRFARMIAAGEYPFGAEETEPNEAPRVGDGVARLDASARVDYASPNFVSVLHRMGIHGNVHGARLGELGFDESMLRAAFAICLPMLDEVEHKDITALVRCIPFMERGKVTGGVVLMRDVSDLRRRDRLLISKDATIREIHHRVKNNLQTISSLLRLQGRRVEVPEAREALEEAVRRIRSIALVHETLSSGATQEVDFGEIVRTLVRMVERGPAVRRASGAASWWRATAGSCGPRWPRRWPSCSPSCSRTPSATASPSTATGPTTGRALRRRHRAGLARERRQRTLLVRVEDDGVGLPEDFSLDGPTPRSHHRAHPGPHELGGTIDFITAGGAKVELGCRWGRAARPSRSAR